MIQGERAMVQLLQDACLRFLVENFSKFKIDHICNLPLPILNQLIPRLAPLDLRKLEIALGTPQSENQGLWQNHYAYHFPIYYRGSFKAVQTNEVHFCVVVKNDGNYRRRFLEDHFHVLIEDANKITALLQRGVLEVNLFAKLENKPSDHQEKACCHVKLEQIKADMLLCAPYVRSLKVFRSKVFMSPLLKEVLNVLVESVICLRLVFLHDYPGLKETINYFMRNGKIIDFHTTWQPQRCALPPKYSVEILSLLAGLQLPPLAPVEGDEAESEEASSTAAVAWSPYDLYDYAVAGSRLNPNSNHVFECAAVQGDRAVTHISISSFLLTQHTDVHEFVANTLISRWISLESLKLACLNHIDIDMFKSSIVHLVEHHNLRQICFEDTQFTEPMETFISLVRVLIRKPDKRLDRLTMLGIGRPFSGDYSAELIEAGEFYGIKHLDLSFSALNNKKCVPTFCEYLKRDKALRSLNLNCCKLLNGEATAQLLRAIGESTITELILDFNSINNEQLEDALISLLNTNRNLESLSCTLCSFHPNFLRDRLFPAIAELPKLTELFLAENRIGDMPELKDLIITLLKTRPFLKYLDLSSNFLSGSYLLSMADDLAALRRGILFKGLNINFNLDRGEVLNSKDIVRERYKKFCQHFFCMILYEDPAEPARLEHAAQM